MPTQIGKAEPLKGPAQVFPGTIWYEPICCFNYGGGGSSSQWNLPTAVWLPHKRAHRTVRSNSQQFSAFRVVSETFMVTKAPGMLLQPPFITETFPVFCSCVTFQLPNLQIPFSQVCCKISQNPCEKPTIQCSSLCSSFPFSSNSPPGDASKQEKKEKRNSTLLDFQKWPPS